MSVSIITQYQYICHRVGHTTLLHPSLSQEVVYLVSSRDSGATRWSSQNLTTKRSLRQICGTCAATTYKVSKKAGTERDMRWTMNQSFELKGRQPPAVLILGAPGTSAVPWSLSIAGILEAHDYCKPEGPTVVVVGSNLAVWAVFRLTFSAESTTV